MCKDQNLRKTLLAAALSMAILHPGQSIANDLPVIGNSSSAISLDQEYQLGQTWARIFRGSAKEYGDPLTAHYIDELLWSLAATSQLQDHRLELLILDNPTLNAFAVPGGVIGIHTGLLLGAQNEAELASVIAHELAHLSQRHYAQRLEEARSNKPYLFAAILASILVGASNPDAAAAGISSSVAATQQANLNFSRRMEQEADRIGMQNLVAAEYDPYAMPDMFSRIQRSTRFIGQKPPEFLLTHPVTESRISDAQNRARQLPKPAYKKQSFTFDLIRKRLEVDYSKDIRQSVNTYRASADSSPPDRYGLALALMRNNQFSDAMQELSKLPSNYRNDLYVKLTATEIMLAAGQTERAVSQLRELDKLYPDSYPVRMTLSRAYTKNRQFEEAADLLEQLSQNYPNNSHVWYELAESYGQSGNTLGVHEARSEYFLLNGIVDKALQQLDFALRDQNLNQSDRARLEQQKKEAEAVRDAIKSL